MNRYSELVFVTSLHLGLFALLTKPVEPGYSGLTVVLGLGSGVLFVIGVLYELGSDTHTGQS